MLVVALPILTAWWMLRLVTLGGGDWTNDPASLFPKYNVPRKIGEAISGAIGGAIGGAFGAWGLGLSGLLEETGCAALLCRSESSCRLLEVWQVVLLELTVGVLDSSRSGQRRGQVDNDQ